MLKSLEVIENPEFKHEDMISDFSYVVDDNKEVAPQHKEGEGKQGEVLDMSENINDADDSHGWLKDHIAHSPGRDRINPDELE